MPGLQRTTDIRKILLENSLPGNPEKRAIFSACVICHTIFAAYDHNIVTCCEDCDKELEKNKNSGKAEERKEVYGKNFSLQAKEN